MRKLVVMTAVFFLTGYVHAMAQTAEFGDMTSKTLTEKAWAALANNDVSGVEKYVHKNVELYGAKAQEMQASLREYPYESRSRIFSFWALNDVGTSFFILGEAYQNAGRKDEARKAFQQVLDNYRFAQCWDSKGFFWKVAIGAKKQLEVLGQ